jgi:cystathionine beta-lyase
VHAGTWPDEVSGGINSPIYTSSATEYLDREFLTYPRYFNTPNQRAVVEKVGALEGAEDGVLFSSGMAAMSTAILAFAGAGDHVVMQEELYGGTHAFAAREFERLGIRYSFAATDAAAVCAAVREDTKVIVIESPTNPLLSVVDVRAVTALARARGITTVMDNTFATPIHQNPVTLGVDVVVHSGTKYLGGHSDLCCGLALTDRARAGRMREMGHHLGGSLNAMTCYLLERSLKTLALRVERQTENAARLAEFLFGHPAVRRVNYPGLPSFPGHAVARSQMSGFGGMLSFELDDRTVRPRAFLDRLRLIRPAVSLGGVESTICAPVETSHAKLPVADRQRIGISDALLRLSTGVEHAEDLIADLAAALDSK